MCIRDRIKAESETVQALGMTGATFDRWHKARGAALAASIKAGDVGGTYSAVSYTHLDVYKRQVPFGI